MTDGAVDCSLGLLVRSRRDGRRTSVHHVGHDVLQLKLLEARCGEARLGAGTITYLCAECKHSPKEDFMWWVSISHVCEAYFVRVVVWSCDHDGNEKDLSDQHVVGAFAPLAEMCESVICALKMATNLLDNEGIQLFVGILQ